jgi:hypothetical protein
MLTNLKTVTERELQQSHDYSRSVGHRQVGRCCNVFPATPFGMLKFAKALAQRPVNNLENCRLDLRPPMAIPAQNKTRTEKPLGSRPLFPIGHAFLQG